MVTEEQIRALAYSIWEQEGHPVGKPEEHYYRAKQILEEKEAISGSYITPSPVVIDMPTTGKGRRPGRRKKS